MDDLVLAQDGEPRLAIRLAQDQEAMQFVHRAQLLMVEPDQDVVLLHASIGGRGALLDRVDQNAGTLAQLVEARDPFETIGGGTHQRVVVNVARFDERVQHKLHNGQ